MCLSGARFSHLLLFTLLSMSATMSQNAWILVKTLLRCAKKICTCILRVWDDPNKTLAEFYNRRHDNMPSVSDYTTKIKATSGAFKNACEFVCLTCYKHITQFKPYKQWASFIKLCTNGFVCKLFVWGLWHSWKSSNSGKTFVFYTCVLIHVWEDWLM